MGQALTKHLISTVHCILSFSHPMEGRDYPYPHFTDEKNSREMISHLSKVTQKAYRRVRFTPRTG